MEQLPKPWLPQKYVDQNGECSRTSRFYQTESNSTCRKFDKTNLKKQHTSLNIIDLASSQVVQGFQIYVQVLFQGASHQTAPASTVLSWNWMMGLALAEWGVTSWVNGGESVCNEYIYIVIVYIYNIWLVVSTPLKILVRLDHHPNYWET